MMMHGRFTPALYSVPASLTPSYARKEMLRPSIFLECLLTQRKVVDKENDTVVLSDKRPLLVH
jgi:hypothetical protein